MNTFFETIWGWFEPFYDKQSVLTNFLSQNSEFLVIGCIMTSISLFTVILYYYILNMPALSKIWCWALFLLGNVLTNLFTGYMWVKHKVEDACNPSGGEIDPETGMSEVATNLQNINGGCFWGFGVTTAILSLFFFLLFTLLLKWWSTNCKRCPF
jgi:hypothetical protein